MRQSKLFITFLFLVFGTFATEAFAAGGISILGVEWGVAKFHRMDNKHHPYTSTNSWLPTVLPDPAKTEHPLVLQSAPNMYTIFFYTLEELLTESAKIAQQTDSKILLFSIHGHGLPGAMWFPKDKATLASVGCADWRSSAAGDDEGNYDQYYSAISKSEIEDFRRMSQHTPHYACTTGLAEWKTVVTKMGGVQKYFSPDAVVSFLSCIVGLGFAGDEFTRGITELVLPANGKGSVRTSMNFGLGDFSMEKGMGFWDYLNDQQLDRDNEIYVRNKRDSDIAQPGQMRVGTNKGALQTAILADQPFMVFNPNAASSRALRGFPGRIYAVHSQVVIDKDVTVAAPLKVRVPGTRAYVLRTAP